MKKLLSVITKSFVILFLALAPWGDKPPKPTPPPKPEKIIRKPCKPLKLSRNGKVKTYSLSDPCLTLYNLNLILGEEGKGTEEILLELLSSEISQTFSQEEIKEAVTKATETFGEIESFNFPRECVCQGDWAEAILEITTSMSQNLKFLVIFHQEAGAWKIFATEEI